jgi:hypothetical protein
MCRPLGDIQDANDSAYLQALWVCWLVFHCWDKMLDTCNVREQLFILAARSWSIRAAHNMATGKQRENMPMCGVFSFFPFYSILAPSLWDGATHSQDGLPTSESSLETPSQTQPEVCFTNNLLGASQFNQVDCQDQASPWVREVLSYFLGSSSWKW